MRISVCVLLYVLCVFGFVCFVVFVCSAGFAHASICIFL